MRRRAIACLFGATVLWGISFVTMRAINLIQGGIAPDLDSWRLTSLSVAVRYALSALVLLAIWRGRGGLTRKEVVQGVVLGFFHGAGLAFQADGLAHTDASVSAFLTQSYCVLLPLWALLRHHKAPGLRTVLSVALIMAGIAVLANIDWRQFRIGRGEGETLISSVLFAGQILWLEKPAYRETRATQITLVMFVSVAVLLLPLVVLRGPGLPLVARLYGPPSVWLLMAVLVLLCTVAATLLMNRWQRDVTATEAGLIYGTEPVYATVFALFLPGVLSLGFGLDYPDERLGAHLLIGGGLILAANVLMQWRRG